MVELAMTDKCIGDSDWLHIEFIDDFSVASNLGYAMCHKAINFNMTRLGP